tara:strand:+ start:126 stop:257 length:132 start_codon:yes stop_codon:yes gene_type:complete
MTCGKGRECNYQEVKHWVNSDLFRDVELYQLDVDKRRFKRIDK